MLPSSYLAKEAVGAVVPLDVQPHAASLGIAGNELVAGHVGDSGRVAIDIQGGGLGEMLARTGVAYMALDGVAIMLDRILHVRGRR